MNPRPLPLCFHSLFYRLFISAHVMAGRDKGVQFADLKKALSHAYHIDRTDCKALNNCAVKCVKNEEGGTPPLSPSYRHLAPFGP